MIKIGSFKIVTFMIACYIIFSIVKFVAGLFFTTTIAILIGAIIVVFCSWLMLSKVIR